MTDYRADELASMAGITVALLRSYQSKGLLPAPRHVGRTAVYGDHHLERLRRIEALKARGHSLRSIAEQVDAPPGFRPDNGAGERLRLRDVSERSDVPERREEALVAMAAAIGELVAYLLERQVLAHGEPEADGAGDLEHAAG